VETYTFNQHRHNFATWTAARAVQRNFTTTANIKYAIDKSGLHEFIDSEEGYSSDEYDQLHIMWAERLQKALEEKEVNNCTYGRAAKIISIYLKTSVILCNSGDCAKSGFIHPPIDGILLKNLSKLEGLKDFRNIRWTQLSKEEYWGIVARLRNHFKKFDWTLEYYWSPD
jgi:hypothetical protein